MAVEVEGLADQGDDPLRQRGRFGGIVDGGVHDHEFIPTHSRDGIGLADQPAQPVGDHLQELVAGGMAKRVVDGLELVEIEVVNRQHFLAMNALAQRLLQPLVQQHAIGEIGKRVVVGHVFDLDLGSPLLGDIFMGGNPAAVGHRAVTNLEGFSVAQLDNAVGRLVGDGNVGAPSQVFFRGHLGKAACLKAQVDDFGQRRAGMDPAARKVIHVDIAVVADDQPMSRVEET